MNPPSITQTSPDEPILDAVPVFELRGYVRGVLVGVALGLMSIFAIALWLNPYQPDGSRRTMGTHQQMGLPECSFLTVTGVPCPSCGMTTSFSLLVRGDVFGSLYANAAGTVLALVALLLIPWCLASAWYGEALFVRSLEWTLVSFVVAFSLLVVLRWAIVVALAWPGRPAG